MKILKQWWTALRHHNTPQAVPIQPEQSQAFHAIEYAIALGMVMAHLKEINEEEQHEQHT